MSTHLKKAQQQICGAVEAAISDITQWELIGLKIADYHIPNTPHDVTFTLITY